MKTSFLCGICLFAVLLFGAGHLQLAFGGDEEKIQIKRNTFQGVDPMRFIMAWMGGVPVFSEVLPTESVLDDLGFGPSHPEPKTEVKPAQVDPILYWLLGLGIPPDVLFGGGSMSSVEPPKLELEGDPPIESVLNDLGKTFVLDDGTVVTIYGNGLRITSYKDGTSVTVDPEAGTRTTRDKDGKVTKEERLDSRAEGGTGGGDPGPPPGRGGAASSTQTATGTGTPTPGTQAKEKADRDKFEREVRELRDKIDKEKNPRRQARLVKDLNEKYRDRFGGQAQGGPVH